MFERGNGEAERGTREGAVTSVPGLGQCSCTGVSVSLRGGGKEKVRLSSTD